MLLFSTFKILFFNLLFSLQDFLVVFYSGSFSLFFCFAPFETFGSSLESLCRFLVCLEIQIVSAAEAKTFGPVSVLTAESWGFSLVLVLKTRSLCRALCWCSSGGAFRSSWQPLNSERPDQQETGKIPVGCESGRLEAQMDSGKSQRSQRIVGKMLRACFAAHTHAYAECVSMHANTHSAGIRARCDTWGQPPDVSVCDVRAEPRREEEEEEERRDGGSVPPDSIWTQ